MENHTTKRHVAIIENCALTVEGFRQLLQKRLNCPCQLYAFRDSEHWFAHPAHPAYDFAIYSVADTRDSRQQCIQFFTHLAKAAPRTFRVLLTENAHQARLIHHLSPIFLHGMLIKTMTTKELLLQAKTLLSRKLKPGSSVEADAVGLSPTERTLLYYMGTGLSIAEIAVRMERNAKTIRTHKFNVMTKLGVSNDTGLLCAADILCYQPLHTPLVTTLKDKRQSRSLLPAPLACRE
ncbi:LuxR C-terminal-related transcriptional regulator [Scandinavium sp. NPDC088450]|uniref:LuxR C-terminal-related transcriptional regulator n=1 Tax=Scandinavium sp. NPDC088450 TaxID=3364514 RepID=UPI00384B38BD